MSVVRVESVPATAPATSVFERWRLGSIAVLGVIAYQLLLVGPLVALLALNPWADLYGPWPPLLVGLFFVWAMQPTHKTSGTLLERGEAPALFALLDDTAARIGAPRIHEVRLVNDFNAAALEAPWPRQPWRKRRVLMLGVPLLALTDMAVVRGVIAHELGHFSHRHGRLGHWIYRTRMEWSALASVPLSETSLLQRGAARFARWFAPWFSTQAFGYSRRCEYEADAYGASIVGASDMARGLMTVAVLARRWVEMDRTGLSALIAASPTPPASWLGHVRSCLLADAPRKDEWRAVRDQLTGAADTHPATAERIRALGVPADELLANLQPPATVAGEELLPTWAEAVAAYDADWRSMHERLWRQDHLRQRHLRAWLDRLRDAGDESLARAELELEFGECAVASTLAARAAAAGASPARATFVQGRASLADGDPRGVEQLEACIRLDPTWALAARLVLAGHAVPIDVTARRRNEKLLEQAAARRGRAMEALQGQLLSARLSPASMDGPALQVLREALAELPVVAAAWCAQADEVTHDGRRYRGLVLVLRLHPQGLREQSLDEEEIADELRALLVGLVPADSLSLVWTAFTTEPLPPALDALLDGWSRAGDPCCLVQPVAGESVGPGAQASALG